MFKSCFKSNLLHNYKIITLYTFVIEKYSQKSHKEENNFKDWTLSKDIER